MNRYLLSWQPFALVVLALAATSTRAADDPGPSPEQIEFFERKIRPVFAKDCYGCHSARAEKLKGGLYLDSRAGLIKGGDSGSALVPGNPGASRLVTAILYRDSELEMPPKAKLPDNVIADIEAWVKMGAPWPEEKGAKKVTPAAEKEGYDFDKARSEHWAFRPVKRPEPPKVEDDTWPTRPIDRFVLAKLEATKLTPSEPAERRILVRRAYLGLLGTPPTPEEIAAFESDERVDAWERVVDALLSSPRYGERWARHWLDVARYNDGFGAGFDGGDKPGAWVYRDWVVESLNDDLPYDEFVMHQVAGDLLDKDSARPQGRASRAFLGTGFLSLGPKYSSDGGDPEAKAKAEADTLEDRLDTTFRGFMGLTIACARCHDHKFDPIPMQDYYSLAGVFRNTRELDRPASSNELEELRATHDAAVKDLDGKIKQLAESEKNLRAAEVSASKAKENAAKIEAIARKAEKAAVESRVAADEAKREREKLQGELASLKKRAPPGPTKAHVVADSGNKDMHIGLRGDLRKKGPLAPRRFLRLVAGEERQHWKDGSGRAQLAKALADRKNPLTPRVAANRVWMHHFGRALVGSPDNFGKLGEKPTHPGLLDWLAASLVDSGWSVKRLHREILLSSTYRQSSDHRDDCFEQDGGNFLLWRMSPRRLEVEAWRDSVLTVTGELDSSLGGPSTKNLLGDRRRTLYSVISRNGDRFESDRFLRLFDFPAARISNPKREVSTVPQQYLFLMNSGFMVERAKQFAARLARAAENDAARIDLAYRLLYGRAPSDEEKATGLSFLAVQSEGLPRWQRYAQVLLSTHELMQVQ